MPKSNRNLPANLRPGRLDWPVVIHSSRTAVAAIASVAAARLARLPEAYWAPVTTPVIAQSSLGAAMAVSRERFACRALGAALSALVASYFGPRILVSGRRAFPMGFLCVSAHLDRSAYRFGGVTLAIVLLIPRSLPAWRIAFNRFAEVSIGIEVALLLATLWPEKNAAAAKQ